METPQLTHNVHAAEVPAAVFVREVLGRALPYVETFRWATDQKALDLSNYPVLIRQKGTDSEEAVVVMEDCCALVEVAGGFAAGEVAGVADGVAVAIEHLRLLLPPAERDQQRLEIPLTFWRTGGRGPVSSRRKISVLPWEAVKENYSSATRRQLESLINEFRPPAAGRLLLWHGEPGTGKTHALRSLAWEWRNWCRVEYVIDCERLLGDGDYLMRVLLEDPERDFEFELDDGEEKPGPHWRLLALEDAGELMAADARDQVGQRLSRLLNTVDGLLGDGLRLLILITTNEELSSLHPAVSRFGRCAAEVEFSRFTAVEAKSWGRARGSSKIARTSMTLAEMFAAVEGKAIRSQTSPPHPGTYL